MKTFNKLFIAAIAATSMTACNNELGEQTLNKEGNVNFTMGIGNTPSSRVSMPEDSYRASFTANDEVGIFVADVPSYTNVKYSTTDGTTWTGGPVNVSADAAYTYYAYYPYSESMVVNDIPVVVATNQDTDGYIKNDYLYSKLAATAGQKDVNLTFSHALSLVEVTLAGSGAAEGATVDLLNVAIDATIDLTAENPVTTGTNTATVTMDALSNLKYRAIVPAQDIAATTPIFKIAVNGRTYQAKYSGVMKFERGKYLAMTITLGEQGGDAEIEITASASINDWEAGTSNGGQAEIEEVPLISEFEDAIPVVLTDAVKDMANSSWFNILNAAYSTASVSDVETAGSVAPEWWTKQANLNFTSKYDSDAQSANANSWYTAVLGYFYKGAAIYTKETSKYKLSFKAKGSFKSGATENDLADDEEGSKIYVVCRNATNSACFAIRNNTDTPTATYSTSALTSEWKVCNFYIHFDKKIEGSPITSSAFVATSSDDYQSIQIRINTNNSKADADKPVKTTSISITDVKLEPYIE